jgi:hypothetical protein
LRPHDLRRRDFSDLRGTFPDWLPPLRAAGYRLDALSPAERPDVMEGLRSRQIALATENRNQETRRPGIEPAPNMGA